MTVDLPLTFGALEFTGGTIDGTDSLTLSLATSLWTGGEFSGPDVTANGMSIGAGATKKITSGARLTLAGSTTWTGDNLSTGGGAIIINTGNFTATATAKIAHDIDSNRATFTNHGTFTKSTAGTITELETVFNNHGAVEVSAGILELSGGGSSSGSIVIASGASAFNGDFTAQNLRFEGGSLTGPASLHGTMAWTGGDWVGNATFTVAADGALTLDGAGDKRLYHGSTGSGGRALANQGTLVWQGAGNLLLGDGAQLSIANGATLDIRSDAALAHTGFGDTGSVVNSGTVVKNAGPGTTTLAQPFTQNTNGNLIVNMGTLAFTSSFTNNGSIHLGDNATLSTSSTLDVHGFSGNGTLRAPTVVSHGVFSPGNSPGLLNISGNLMLLAASTLLIELGGTTQGTSYDYLNVSGTAMLAGNFALSFVNGFQSAVTASDTFTIMTTTGVIGAFANVTSGQRIFTTDGLGSFQIDYGLNSASGANSIVLSNFAYAVPEPSTWGLLGVGALLVGLTVRRRR